MSGIGFNMNNQYHRNLPGAGKAFDVINRGDNPTKESRFDGTYTSKVELSCGSKIYETTQNGRKVRVTVTPDGYTTYTQY